MSHVVLKAESFVGASPILVTVSEFRVTTKEKLDHAIRERRWPSALFLGVVFLSELVAMYATHRAFSTPADRIEWRQKLQFRDITLENEIIVDRIKKRPTQSGEA